MRMKRVILLLTLSLFALNNVTHALQLPDTSEAKSAILYEATTDTILYENNADKQIIPASTTKIMTAILVIEHDPQLAGELTVKKEAITYTSHMDSSHLEEGEVLSVKDCLSYMLIRSGNEAASALAVHVAGSVPAFVDMMNDMGVVANMAGDVELQVKM